jgi:membrane associated rhomboid family serine protease
MVLDHTHDHDDSGNSLWIENSLSETAPRTCLEGRTHSVISLKSAVQSFGNNESDFGQKVNGVTGSMRIISTEGFRVIRTLGFISFLVLLFTLPPTLLDSNSDRMFVIPALIGTLLGVAGYFFSRVILELDSETKTIKAWRPFWPNDKHEYRWDSSFKIALTSRQHKHGYHYVPLLILEDSKNFYFEKHFYGLRAKARAIEEFQRLQVTVYGEIRSSEIPRVVQEGEWRPRGYEAVLSVLGLPVEIDTNYGSRKPWLTWLIALVAISISLIALYVKTDWIDLYGLSTDEPFRQGGLTWLSSFFLHAGIFHLLGNMYFLLVFGDNVELHLGRPKYSALLIVSTLIAGLFQIVASNTPTLMIGASGGIFGVVTYYLFVFPKQEFGVLFFGRWKKVRAIVLFLVFVLTQLYGMSLASDGVAYFAHAGGMLAGFLFSLVGKKKDSE